MNTIVIFAFCAILMSQIFAQPSGLPISKIQESKMDWIQVSTTERGFILHPSGKPFLPWGFNYDHDEDEKERLLEDYWITEWTKVEEDFQEMKELGANVIRIHLQLGRFMIGPDQPNKENLDQLERLVALAEQIGVYIDLTGLGNYRKSDTPEWYSQLSEEDRWLVQARFWEAIASRMHHCPALFCYNLMNEPAVPAECQQDWLVHPFMNGRYYVEYLTIAPGHRSRLEVGQKWLRTMTKAIRKYDSQHLITVGVFFINEHADHLPIGTTPEELVCEVDFMSVHLYPKEGELDKTLNILKRLNLGKPVVVEEIAPLYCSVPSLGQFIENSRVYASGWIGFYWGKTLKEYQHSEGIQAVVMAEWLAMFQKNAMIAQEKNGSRD